MFSVGVSDHCMVAHSFADPFFGPAQRLHGATYEVDLEVRSPTLGKHHVVMDIGALRGILRQVLAELDYSNLDDHAAFPDRTSTSERIAEHVADRVAGAITRLPADDRPIAPAVLRARLRESSTAWVAFERPL
jgi:6-pyruvoyltetrahydropterin/6-carboxytetrahydropterin synthase